MDTKNLEEKADQLILRRDELSREIKEISTEIGEAIFERLKALFETRQHQDMSFDEWAVSQSSHDQLFSYRADTGDITLNMLSLLARQLSVATLASDHASGLMLALSTRFRLAADLDSFVRRY